MLLLFLSLITCLQYQLDTGPDSSLEFDKESKANERLKFEYHEENENAPIVRIVDSFDREVAYLDSSYCVLHWAGSTENVYYFKIENQTKKPMSIYMRIPDVDEEVSNALGHITDKDVVAEYEHSLKKSLQDQRSYLERLKEHEDLTVRTRRMVSWLVIVEIVSCCGFIYYLHKRTVALFEKKQRA